MTLMQSLTLDKKCVVMSSPNINTLPHIEDGAINKMLSSFDRDASIFLFPSTHLSSGEQSTRPVNDKRDDVSGEPPREQCKTCMFTGMATCAGLSLYFLKLWSELPDSGTKQTMRQVSKQRNFLLGGSAAWAIAGIYRGYLG